MTELYTLQAKLRELIARKTDALRAENTVPAIMYGFETEPTNLQVNRSDFVRIFDDAGTSSILQLQVDTVQHPVLIQDVQYDPLTDEVVHVDFRRVNLKEKVETTIVIELEGVSPAVKNLGGILVQSLEEVEVEALPTALVREFVLDISSLENFNDMLHVSDIKVPQGIEILNDPEETVVIIQEPREEEPETPVEEGIEAANGEQAKSESKEKSSNEQTGK